MATPIQCYTRQYLYCTTKVGSTLTDPTTLTFRVLRPGGAWTSYTWAAGDITRNSVGDFEMPLDVDDDYGLWKWTARATGAVIDYAHGYFSVERPPDI